MIKDALAQDFPEWVKVGLFHVISVQPGIKWAKCLAGFILSISSHGCDLIEGLSNCRLASLHDVEAPGMVVAKFVAPLGAIELG